MKRNTSLKSVRKSRIYYLFTPLIALAFCLIASGQPNNQNPPTAAEALAQKVSKMSMDEARAVLTTDGSLLSPVDVEKALKGQAEKLELDGDFNHALNLYQLSMA